VACNLSEKSQIIAGQLQTAGKVSFGEPQVADINNYNIPLNGL
jgi:hypothetical protein